MARILTIRCILKRGWRGKDGAEYLKVQQAIEDCGAAAGCSYKDVEVISSSVSEEDVAGVKTMRGMFPSGCRA